MLKNIALQTIKEHKLICKNDHIIVGVSGGADSICLLHFLNSIKEEFKLKITVVHINHLMRADESDEDCKFVENFCDKINVPVRVFAFDIYKKAKEENISIEEAGRKYRYFAFNKVLQEKKGTKIAIAHNKDDNAETMFMNFFRGTGLKGLSGIVYKRDNIIRPILDCLREDIEKYCEKNNLTYRNDSTNSKDIYTRNKIRLNVLPMVKENFNPNVVESLSNMSKNFYEEDKFLDKLTEDVLNDCLIEKTTCKISLDIEKIKDVDIVIKKRLLRLCLLNFNKSLYNISYQHINIILNLLENQTGKEINLPNNIYVYKQYNYLIISKNSSLEAKNIAYNYKINLDEKIYVKEINKNILLSKNIVNISTKVYTISLNYDKIKHSLFIRQRKDGDKIYINNMTKKVKNIFIDFKIPINERNLYPIILHNDEIIGILGICISNEYKSKANIVYLHIWEEN